ncbi:MAG: hypothetical protein AAF729_08565 [Pseudomonadota bacterium]
MLKVLFAKAACVAVIITIAITTIASAQERPAGTLTGVDRFVASTGAEMRKRNKLVTSYFGEVVCPMLPAEFGCGCYLDGFRMPCDFVANCLSVGFCEPANTASTAVLLREAAERGTVRLTIAPQETGTVAECSADDGAACDILAAACEEIGGTGQCGGPNNPDGCECQY